ncbi:MAG: hypothetical protein AAB389_00325 [Patescibacteria group bacterium]
MVVATKALEETILRKLKQEKLPPIILKMKKFFGTRSIESYTFLKLSRRLVRFFEEAQTEILKVFVDYGAGVDLDPLDLPYKLVIGEMNGALPKNFPFVVAICKCQSIPNECFFGVVPKSHIPGIHEMIRQDIVPICTCDTPQSISKQKITLWRSPEAEKWLTG